MAQQTLKFDVGFLISSLPMESASPAHVLQGHQADGFLRDNTWRPEEPWARHLPPATGRGPPTQSRILFQGAKILTDPQFGTQTREARCFPPPTVHDEPALATGLPPRHSSRMSPLPQR
jgi:hypothetical protein